MADYYSNKSRHYLRKIGENKYKVPKVNGRKAHLNDVFVAPFALTKVGRQEKSLGELISKYGDEVEFVLAGRKGRDGREYEYNYTSKKGNYYDSVKPYSGNWGGKRQGSGRTDKITKQFQEICGGILNGISVGSRKATKIMEKALAEAMLRNAVANRGFNSFSGALVRSYRASIVSSRTNKLETMTPESVGIDNLPDRNTPYPTSDGKQRIARSEKIHDGRRTREYKRWEKDRYFGSEFGRQTQSRGKIKNRRDQGFYGGNGERSGVILENIAPYSTWVEARHHRVLEGPNKKEIWHGGQHKFGQLVQRLTRKEILRLGFKVK